MGADSIFDYIKDTLLSFKKGISNSADIAEKYNKNLKKDNKLDRTDIAGYINNIPVKKATTYDKAWTNRRVNEEHIIDLMYNLYNMFGQPKSNGNSSVELPLPTMPNKSYEDTFSGRLEKAMDLKAYLNQLRAYTDLNRAKIMANTRKTNNANNPIAGFINLYNLLTPETETLNKNSVYSMVNANQQNTITPADKIKLATSIANALSKDSTGTVTPDVILNTIKSIIPEAFANQPKKEQNKPISEEDLQKIIKVLED